ncbi:hypothetical protein CHUAL_004033 [Chamberlinius hualienensis]
MNMEFFLRVLGVTILLLTSGRVGKQLTTGKKVTDRSRDRCNKTVDLLEEVTSPSVNLKNRGQPLLCWYHIRAQPNQKDWIISVRFFRFKVGRLVNATTCANGHVQIIDGGGAPNASRPLTSPYYSGGYHCGESDHTNTFISETDRVTVIFYVEQFSDETYMSFDSRGEPNYLLIPRHGTHSQLYPTRRGTPVPGTICDRVFDDCRLGYCYIQSPGYPGVYPRNLRCRYHVTTATRYIRLYTENELIDVDGQRCSDVMTCPVRSVTHNQCPYDQIRIYDGPTEESPLIGCFCGRGKFPYSIVGSGRQLLLVFVTSPAGPLISTGFSFHVGQFSKSLGSGATLANGSCDAIFHSSTSPHETDRRFYSLSTWYPNDTSCSFTILAESNEVIRLWFKTLRVTPQQHAIMQTGECAETLTIYDSHTRDDSKLLTTICDTWPQPVVELDDFISTGPAMFVQFTSASGSYMSSSIDFWINFDFYNAYQYGKAVGNTLCDEVFQAAKSYNSFSPSYPTDDDVIGHGNSNNPNSVMHNWQTERFSSPLNNLIFRRPRQITCRYRFEAGPSAYSRVLLTFDLINFTTPTQQCVSCNEDSVDKILIVDRDREVNVTMSSTGASYCMCDSSPHSGVTKRNPVTFLSSGPNLDVILSIDSKSTLAYFKRVRSPIFQGSYRFLHDAGCGPSLLDVRNQGELVFPDPISLYNKHEPDDENEQHHMEAPWHGQSAWLVRCIWTIQVSMRKDIYLRFENLNIDKNCSLERIEIRIPDRKHTYVQKPHQIVCGGNDGANPQQQLDLPIINSGSLTSNRILVEYRSTKPISEQNFKLVWTELSQVEHHSKYTMDPHHLQQQSSHQQTSSASMAVTSADCYFVCEGSNTCIPQSLVCNGVRNCPLAVPYYSDVTSSTGVPSTTVATNKNSDEDIELCKIDEAPVNWLAICLGAAGGAIFALCFILLVHRCYRRCRHESEPG